MAGAEGQNFGRNAEYPWNEFDAERYFRRNYSRLRSDDRRIVEIVRDYFADCLSAPAAPVDRRGIDVGTGANLSPLLAMLPFCERLTAYEFSGSNIQWLVDQRAQNWPSWNDGWSQVWEILCARDPYRALDRPRVELSKRVDIVRGSVLNLDSPDSALRWDMGTMFFVAESITGQRAEFLAAVRNFLNVLKLDALFAMAFMEHSLGYDVGRAKFPAVSIGMETVEETLRGTAHDVVVQRIPLGEEFLRTGYTGMIVAHGRAGN